MQITGGTKKVIYSNTSQQVIDTRRLRGPHDWAAVGLEPTPHTRHGYDWRVESWVDSESNAFWWSHELIWIEKWGRTLSHESIWINTWGMYFSHELILSQFLESRLSHQLNRLKSSWYCLSHELIQIKALSRMPKKRSTKFGESPKKVNEIEWNPQKRSTELSESPKKVNEIISWFESLSHDLIQINIPDFLGHELIWIKILESFLIH